MAGAIIISLFFLSLFFRGAPILIFARENECKPRRCDEPDNNRNGPTVRFPFWLKGRHPAHCGYPDPAFALSCSPDNTSTFLELPSSSVKLFVEKIDYKHQVVILTPPGSSINFHMAANNINNGSSGLLPLLQDLSAASSPFQLTFIAREYFRYNSEACIGDYSTNCSLRRLLRNNPEYGYYSSSPSISLVSCPSSSTNGALGVAVGGGGSSSSPAHDIQYIYAVCSDAAIEGPLLSCTKLYTVSPSRLPIYYYYPHFYSNYGIIVLSLSWYKPDCSKCESKRNKYCSSSNGSWENGTTSTIECHDIPGPKRLVVAGKLPVCPHK